MPLCEWHTFWMVPWLICYFIVMSFCIERKWLLMRNLAIILHLKSLENFYVSILSMKVSKYWKIVEFPKTSIEMKNRKTYYKAQTTSHLKEIIQPLPTPIPPDKILLRLWNKRFLRGIYRNVQTCFQSTSRM